MLENWRYNRSLEAFSKQNKSDTREVFFEQEYLTQLALDSLGVREAASPSEVSKVGSLFMAPESIPGLRTPYAVEVLGMPGAGKTTMINRYLGEVWQRNERNKVALVDEGVKSIKGEYGDLRYSDPFSYSLLGGTETFVDYIGALKNVNSGMRMIVSDRGQIDRRTFRRALFSRGDVSPSIMENEGQFIDGLENTPVQMCGTVMLMVRPEKTLKRINKVGPVTNTDFLNRLYEQYWRLHQEMLQGEVPYRVYTCIDAEESEEKVYERFKYALDTMLNIHTIYLTALTQAFPEEVDQARKSMKTPQLTHAQKVLGEKLGGKVLIVGGDDMESDEEILNKPFVEGIRLKK
ncbi:deoxynucleoside kinase [Candidatus Shapirobacteria bacterium]|nr:deoxynucleoside kinase [Candidatus Shapirobacteria bacterium]